MSKEEPFVTYDPNIQNLVTYMKTLRIIFGLSLDDLADILGITRATLLKYEHGSQPITPLIYLAIRGALFDVAERVNDENYYKLLWYLFINDVAWLKTGNNDPILARTETIEQIKNNISHLVLDFYEKRNRKAPLYEIGLSLKKEIKENFSYIF